MITFSCSQLDVVVVPCVVTEMDEVGEFQSPQMTEQEWASRRHSAIVFSVDDEFEKTPSGRIYPKDVIERHHHHHHVRPLRMNRQLSPVGRQSPERRSVDRKVSDMPAQHHAR